MVYSSFLAALALSANFIDGALTLSNGILQNRNTNGFGVPNIVARQDATATCVAAKSIATGSVSDGQGKGVNGVAAGQSPSETDTANFIHACDGKTITNGQQTTGGSCNPIPMGDIPAVDSMVTTIITNPGPGDDIEANKDFDIKLQINNLNAGVFTNPQVTYYSAPQRLKNGKIIGHVHVTIQDLGGSFTPNTPPDPTKVAFFKGIDDAGDGKGGLKDTVAGGLPPGFYRLCTMSSASNHQPVIMPVAKRGAQDDCTKFTVGQGKGANGGGNAGENKNGANSGGAKTGRNADGNNNGANAGGNNNGGNAGGNNNGANAGGNNNGGNAGGNKNGGNAGGNSSGSSSGGNKNSGNDNGNNKGANSGGDNNGDNTGGTKKATKSGNNDNAGNVDGQGGNNRKAATASTPGSAQPSGTREGKRFEGGQENTHQQRRGPMFGHNARHNYQHRSYEVL